MNEPAATSYETFFGLKLPPFSVAPDPRFLFAGASHAAALAEVAYAVERREPIVVVTGEIGTGKTLLCRAVLQRLPRRTFVSIVSDPLLGPDELLRRLLEDFGVISKDWQEPASARRHDLAHAMHAFLKSLGAIEAHAVVIIDEAQHLQPAVLEQIRLLANVEDERGTLLQIVLAGQSDVEPLLSKPELRQIRQRVSRRIRLEPLTHDEVRQYIDYRLTRAREGAPSADVPGAVELARALVDFEGGARPVEFEPAAIDAVAHVSGGVPRLINLLCDRALETAFAARRSVIDVADVVAAARALRLELVPATAPAATPAHTVESMQWQELVDAAREAPSADALAEPEPAVLEPAPTGARRERRLVVAAVLLAAAGTGAWIGWRTIARNGAAPAHPVLATPAAPAATAPRIAPPKPAVTTEAPPPAAPPSSVEPPPASTSEPAAPQPTPPAAADSGFSLVVASFKTEARAAEAEADIARLGIPASHHQTGTWQQVICGPFASRAAAEEAQQRLAASGYAGAQVVAGRR